jgi:hypothetical protein
LTPTELKNLMAEINLNSADVALIVGVTRRGVQMWLSGTVPVPQNVAIFLRAIAEGLLPMTWVEDQVIRYYQKAEPVL